MIQFTIPYPETKRGKAAFCKAYSLNAYYAGKHWAIRKKEADAIHQMTVLSMRRARVRKAPEKEPVRIRFDWDDGLDIDNHAVIGKCVVDAMKGYVLEDDNPRRYVEVTHGFWHGGCIRVTVEAMP